MKKILLLIFFANAVFADFNTLFDEFMKVSKMDERIQKSISIIKIDEIVNAEINDRRVKTSKKKEAEAIFKKYLNEMLNESTKYIKKMYENHYTQDDLRAMIAFYKSNVGKKVAQASLEMEEELQNLIVGMVVKYLPQMQREIKSALQKD